MRIDAVEPLCQSGNMQRVNPGALIADTRHNGRGAQGGVARGAFQRDRDAVVLAAIFDRVFNEVGKDLLQLIIIAAHHHAFGCLKADVAGAVPRQGAQRMQDRADDLAQIDLIARAHALFALDPAERQKIAHEALHPGRFGLHDPQKTVDGDLIVARWPLQRLDKAHERGQRRAQLVADIGHEIAAHLGGMFAFGQILETHERAARIAGFHIAHMHLKAAVAPGLRGLIGDLARLTVAQGGLDRLEHIGLAQRGQEMPSLKPLPQMIARALIGGDDAIIRADQNGGHRNTCQNRGQTLHRRSERQKPGAIPAHVLLVMQRRGAQRGNRRLIEVAHHPARRAHHEAAFGDFLALGDQRARANQAVAPDARAVEHRGPHADQNILFEDAAMQHRLVTDGAARTDDERIAHVGVHDAVLLHIAARAHADFLVVAAQGAAKPDRGQILDHHLADQIGIGRNPGVFGNLRRVAVKAVECHCVASMMVLSRASVASRSSLISTKS